MIKLIVSDFDGTLLPHTQTSLSNETVETIKKLISHNIKFAVASGRTYSELKSLLGELSDSLYFICDDGAVTLKGDNVIFKKPFSKAAINTFFDEYIYKDVILYSLNKAYILGFNSRPVLYGKTPCRVNRPFEITDDIFKVTATAKCFDLVNTNYFRIHYSEKSFVELVSAYANKGVAVADLQLKLGISRYDTLALGDADNDISMMQHAFYSCAIGNRTNRLADVCTSKSETALEVLKKVLNEIENNTKPHLF